MGTRKENFGIVKLGKVTSYAQWVSVRGVFELTFDTRLLSLNEQSDLQRYQESSQPLPVQVPGDCQPAQGVVIGFQRAGRTVKFYVSCRKPAHEKAPPVSADSDALSLPPHSHP